MKTIKLLLAVAILAFAATGFSQSEEDLYKLGMKYKKEVDNTKMLQVFKKLVDMDSTNADYLSELSFAYSKVGANLEDEDLKLKYYKKAKDIAKKAINIDSKNGNAHYSYALALARENENAATKVQIANAKEIRKECELAMKYDPDNPGPYHIMGRWHRTFAGFSNMKKTMVNSFFGGTPEGGTYKDALEMFQKAIELESWYMLHYYELAVTYHEMGDDELAKKYVEKAMKLPRDYEDAKKCYENCKELLEELR